MAGRKGTRGHQGIRRSHSPRASAGHGPDQDDQAPVRVRVHLGRQRLQNDHLRQRLLCVETAGMSGEYKIRIGKQRATWEAAAAREHRTLAGWIKATCDAKAAETEPTERVNARPALTVEHGGARGSVNPT